MSELDRRARLAPGFLALSCVGFVASAMGASPALAQETAPPSEAQATELKGVTVTDSAIEEDAIKVDRVESPKATAPILDTPQTITVISSQTIRQQNLLTLRDALATIPGITFGAGEGGGGYGDSINLRGYSANNDITVDGVRDSAQYSRTDPFNLEQIEVYNGANTVYGGSGSVGGTINLVTKTPKARDLTVIEAGVGTDNYYRGTVDVNKRVTDTIAVRLNAMYHHNDYPGRDVEKYERWGVAPSITIGIDTPTRLTFAYLHQEDDNVPIYGVPYYSNGRFDGPLPGIDESDYFGISNLDKQEITVDQLTMKFEHDFSDAVSIRNLTRWQRVHQLTWSSAPQGTWCLADGTVPTGAACAEGQLPGLYYPSGPRGLSRDQENQMLYNQLDLTFVSGEEGGTRNTLVIGASYAKEDYDIATGQLLRNPGGALPNPTQPPVSISDPNTIWAGPVNYVVTGKNTAETTNKAIYAFDTLELGIVELNAGIRYENQKSNFRTVGLGVYPPGTTAPTDAQLVAQKMDESLFSYRLGVVVKPTEATSLYASYANSKTPSSATVRSGCGTVVVSPVGTYDPCAVAPEKARSFEIGAKADVIGGALQLTAAFFRNERSNFRVASNDPTLPASIQVLDGKSRVDGIALGATGRITDAWSVFANYTYLDSKIKQSVSDFCLQNPGTNGCAAQDFSRGDYLIQTPKHSGSLWTTYTLPFGLTVGYGLTYQDSILLNQRSSTAPVQLASDDYLTHRAMVSYAFENGLTAQVNVQNFTNEKYYTNIRNNGWAMPGEDRSARLSLFYSF